MLVGHSAGGLSLSHAIHVFGHKIAVAVYIAATMLSHGFCTDEDVQQVGLMNPKELLLFNVVICASYMILNSML